MSFSCASNFIKNKLLKILIFRCNIASDVPRILVTGINDKIGYGRKGQQ